MAWTEVLQDDDYSVGFGAESTLGTEVAATVWIDCEMPQISYDPAQTETKRSRRGRGMGTPRHTGKVWPKLSMKFPLCGQLAAYAFATDTPDFNGAMGLLKFLGGTSTITYAATNISPTDGNTMSLISTPKYGCLVAAREASGLVNAMGFVKTITGAGPYATDLFEDLKAQPGASVARIPSITMYPTATQPSPLTIRITGSSAAMDRRFPGCLPTKVDIEFDQDDHPWATVEFISYGTENRSAAAGGLQPLTECLTLEPMVARGGGRYVVASNLFTTLADGTVDADGTCDVRDLKLSWTFAHYVARQPTKAQGAAQVLVRNPVITAEFTVPDITDFEVGGEHFQEQAWRNETQVSLSCYIGDTPGKIIAWNIPRGNPTVWPDPVFVDGVMHRKISVEAGYYAGDTASTDAGNKALRFSLA